VQALRRLTREQLAAVGARAFGAVTVFLLAGLDMSSRAVITAAAICGLAAAMAALTLRFPHLLGQLALLEALIAGVLIGTSLNTETGALAYSVVAPFVAGIARGRGLAAAAIVTQFVCIDLLTLSRFGSSAVQTRLELSLPWLATSVGTALLGYWLVHDTTPETSGDNTDYESARRLLTQLRTVARRLSAGLDPVGIAQQILTEVERRMHVSLAVVLALSEGGTLQPLAELGDGAARDLTGEDPIVLDAWTNESPVQRPTGPPGSTRYIRLAVPLQVGVRVVGVVVVETDRTLTGAELKGVRESLSEISLRLDTAMVFDEVRSLATAEERRRLAREIHDGIAQEIASVGYLVDGMVADADEHQKGDLKQLRQELSRLTSELRLSIFDLRTEVSPTASLGAVLADHVRLIGSRSGMTVHLSLAEGAKRLPAQTETEILRIAQEAVTNARKHSGARNLHVSLSVEAPYARLVVSDDGRGLGAARDDSFGIKTMRERSDRIGAALRVRNKTTGTSGTEVILVLEDRRKNPRVVPRNTFDHIA